jgi:hypothetical protein
MLSDHLEIPRTPNLDLEQYHKLAASLCADMEKDGFWDETDELHKRRLDELYDAAFQLEGLHRLEAVHVWDTVAKKFIIAEELHRLGIDCDPQL